MKAAAAVVVLVLFGWQSGNWWDALPRPVYANLERVEPQAPWFEVYRVAPGVLALYEPGHFEEVISYLVTGSDRAVLIDTGLGIGAIAPLVRSLTDLPIQVVLTHSHPDHVGGAAHFADVAAFDSEFTRQRLARGYEDLSGLITPTSVWKALPASFDASRYAINPLAPSRWLQDGDRIELGDRTLEVVHTPGHTPGSICLLDRTNGVLFTGDTFYPGPLYAHTADADLDDYIRSARRLGDLASSVNVVCPAHNEPRMEAESLLQLAKAFDSIGAGEPPSETTSDGVRRYDFGRFSVLAPPRVLPDVDRSSHAGRR